MNSLAHLPADALTARLYEIRKEERALLVEFLEYLVEVERRRLFLELGFPSMFVFCTDFLGLSRGSTYRRTKGAELLVKFPIVGDYLADGRLNLRNLVELRDVLEQERLIEILDRAAGRTEDEVKRLVAALRPHAAPPDLLRRLPGPRSPSVTDPEQPDLFAAAQPAAPLPSAELSGPPDNFGPRRGPNTSGPPDTPVSALPAAVESAAAGAPPTAIPAAGRAEPAPVLPVPTRTAGRIQPIAEHLHVLRVTVDDDFVRDLEAVRQALSHKVPSSRLEEVLRECLHVTLAACSKRRRGAGMKPRPRPVARPTKPARSDSRYIPTAIREAVWDRDAGQCTFIGTTGRRCPSKYRLEFHHRDPFAKGGPTTVDNLTLRCRAHNLYAAEQDYGRDFMALKVPSARNLERRR